MQNTFLNNFKKYRPWKIILSSIPYLQYVKDAGFKDIKIESKATFPLELMLADPQIMKVAKMLNYDVDSEEAKDIASRVTSISLSATK